MSDLPSAKTKVISIDNGVSAYYTILDCNGKLVEHAHIPVKKGKNYTKKVQSLQRIDVPKLRKMLLPHVVDNPAAFLERPMINNTRFKQSISAARSFEATLIVLEELGIPYTIVDSKSWQHKFLPGDTASDQLKETANRIAIERFGPTIKEGDSALMALWAQLPASPASL